MDELLNLLALVGPLSLIIALFVVALLSRRLSSALPHRKRYRWLLVACVLAIFGFGLRLIGLTGSDSEMLAYTMFTAIALTIAIPIAWSYWGWLLGEGQRTGKLGKSGQHRDLR
jgi:hypothetical protein